MMFSHGIDIFVQSSSCGEGYFSNVVGRKSADGTLDVGDAGLITVLAGYAITVSEITKSGKSECRIKNNERIRYY